MFLLLHNIMAFRREMPVKGCKQMDVFIVFIVNSYIFIALGLFFNDKIQLFTDKN